MTLLEIRNLSLTKTSDGSVNDISLDIEPGEFFTLLGPAKCGASTLLQLIAGIHAPDKGSIGLNGVDQTAIAPASRNINMVFKNDALFPHMSVAQNIAFPLQMSDIAPAEIQKRVDEWLERFAFKGKEKHLPKNLSRIERKQVSLARALIKRPQILLLDDPFATLLATQREKMQSELVSMQRELGVSVIYVSQDPGEAMALSDRVAIFNRGKVEQVDTPANVYAFPASRFAASFIGHCNLLDCRVRSMNLGRMRLEVAGADDVVAHTESGKMPGTKGALAIRPEQIRIDTTIEPNEDENRCKGKIAAFQFRGSTTVYRVELITADGPGRAIVVAVASSRPAPPVFFDIGAMVEIAWRHEVGHFIEE